MKEVESSRIKDLNRRAKKKKNNNNKIKIDIIMEGKQFFLH